MQENNSTKHLGRSLVRRSPRRRLKFMPNRSSLILSTVAMIACLGEWNGKSLHAQTASFEKPPINYQSAKVDDAVTRLNKRIANGEVKLGFNSDHGYLKSVLESLKVPVSSQGLVFSKTSLQIQRISPSRPRAVYFNDEVYVGWVQNGDVIEIAATDAKQGPTFYTLTQRESESPMFVRDQGQCIVCHASSRTQNVPGYLVRSVYPNRSGHPNYGSGTFTTNITSPFSERWGGWYVTGSHGKMRHMGNATFRANERSPDFDDGANRRTLKGLVNTRPYLSSDSDLVALMVLEHQTQMHNAITFANYETRQALHQSYSMNKLLEREPKHVSEVAKRRIDSAANRVIEHLLMCDEFKLTDAVSGSSSFATEFEKLGPFDSKRRSLRELDLKTRLFLYPCSFLIYSDSFKALPEQVKRPIMERLLGILEGKNDSKTFSHLTLEMRNSILEILRETHDDFRL